MVGFEPMRDTKKQTGHSLCAQCFLVSNCFFFFLKKVSTCNYLHTKLCHAHKNCVQGSFYNLRCPQECFYIVSFNKLN